MAQTSSSSVSDNGVHYIPEACYLDFLEASGTLQKPAKVGVLLGLLVFFYMMPTRLHDDFFLLNKGL